MTEHERMNYWWQRATKAENAITSLHKSERRWTHPDFTGSFATQQEAEEHSDTANVRASFFEICAECGRIESEQPKESGQEWSYRESLWPCRTYKNLKATP
jgi:hypothetical protein